MYAEMMTMEQEIEFFHSLAGDAFIEGKDELCLMYISKATALEKALEAMKEANEPF